MSEFTPPLAQSDRKPTPGVVNFAAYLQWFTVLLGVVGLILTMMYAGDMTDAMVKSYEDQGASKTLVDGAKMGGTIVTVSAVISFVIALVYGLLGVLNRKGKNGSRIATWVLSGIFVLCGAIAMAMNGMSGSNGEVDMDKVTDAASNAVPGFFTAWQTISGILSLVIYVAVIVLLALPAANDFFRKEPPKTVIYDPQAQ